MQSSFPAQPPGSNPVPEVLQWPQHADISPRHQCEAQCSQLGQPRHCCHPAAAHTPQCILFHHQGVQGGPTALQRPQHSSGGLTVQQTQVPARGGGGMEGCECAASEAQRTVMLHTAISRRGFKMHSSAGAFTPDRVKPSVSLPNSGLHACRDDEEPPDTQMGIHGISST